LVGACKSYFVTLVLLYMALIIIVLYAKFQLCKCTLDLNIKLSRFVGGSRNPSPAKLDMVIEKVRIILHFLKRIRIRHNILSPLGGAENFGEMHLKVKHT